MPHTQTATAPASTPERPTIQIHTAACCGAQSTGNTGCLRPSTPRCN